jgi:hypothetical protein
MATRNKDNNKPIVYIKTRIHPFDDGTCRTCYHNHRPAIVQLENGEYIITTPASAPEVRNRKDNDLAALFWPSESHEEEL